MGDCGCEQYRGLVVSAFISVCCAYHKSTQTASIGSTSPSPPKGVYFLRAQDFFKGQILKKELS